MSSRVLWLHKQQVVFLSAHGQKSHNYTGNILYVQQSHAQVPVEIIRTKKTLDMIFGMFN